MVLYTIYNPTTKEIGEELEFADYPKAKEFVNAHYPEGYIAKVNPFHFTSDFYAMLKEGQHGAFKYDKNQKCIAITHGYNIYHCNYLSLQDFVNLKNVQRTGLKINIIELSKKDFINLHNSLIDNPTYFKDTDEDKKDFGFQENQDFGSRGVATDIDTSANILLNLKGTNFDVYTKLQKIRNDIDTLLYKIKKQ